MAQLENITVSSAYNKINKDFFFFFKSPQWPNLGGTEKDLNNQTY